MAKSWLVKDMSGHCIDAAYLFLNNCFMSIVRFQITEAPNRSTVRF